MAVLPRFAAVGVDREPMGAGRLNLANRAVEPTHEAELRMEPSSNPNHCFTPPAWPGPGTLRMTSS